MPNPFAQFGRRPAVHGQPGVTAGSKRSGPVIIAGKRVAWWADFTDLNTLFQDLARTNPADTNGQVVEAVTEKGPQGWHLDEPAITVPTVFKPTLQLVATGGLPALAFDRQNGFTNEGEMIRTSFNMVEFPSAFAFMIVVGNRQDPGGVGGSGLCVGSVEDSVFAQSPGVAGARVTAGDNEAQQANGLDGDFAAWLSNRILPDEGRCSINGLAGLATDSNETPGAFKTPGFLGVGGNQNGGAAGSAWNGTISEIVIFNGEENIPAEADAESYVTGKYGLTWL